MTQNDGQLNSSEILFNVRIDYQLKNEVLQKEEDMEIPCIYKEKVNWIKKATAFFKAKSKFNKSECEDDYK